MLCHKHLGNACNPSAKSNVDNLLLSSPHLLICGARILADFT